MAAARGRKRYYVLGGIVVIVAGVIALWDWDWFIPLADAQASAALGRKVTITHLHVALAERPLIEADGITIANPDGFPDGPPLATVDRLQVRLDIPAYLHDRSISIPLIAITHPVVEARALPDGTNNWTLSTGSGSTGGGATSPSPKLGTLEISDGHVHAVDPKLKADFAVDIATRDGTSTTPAGAQPANAAPVSDATSDQVQAAQQGQGGQGPAAASQTVQSQSGASQIVADAKGTYAGQPITGHFVGGALLSLRDATHPYPIDLAVANGPTHVSLVGTIANPLAFAGADLKLSFAGPNLALLLPLTGIAIPQTPSYDVSGQLDYADRTIRFHHIEGRVGSSDLEGDIDVLPGAERPQLNATLSSRRVDLADLGGFIGSTPGRVSTPDQTAAQRRAVERAEASSQLIPNVPISMPKLKAADVDLKYRGNHIIGRNIPIDDVVVDLTIKDGNIALHPVSFGIGRGAISGNISLAAEKGDDLRAKAEIDFERIELSKLLASMHSFQGAGIIGGRAVIDGTGNSLAGILDTGDGEVKLIMGQGGDISALLVDLSGLEFGNALMSALGIPNKAQLRCLVTDFVLQHGDLRAKTMLLDTSEADVFGTGGLNLRNEKLDFRLRTDAKHFSIGSLKTDILIDGTLKDPSIAPAAGELAARAGAAVALGVLLTPLGALLPTIQFGTGPDNYCAPALQQARKGPAAPPPADTHARR